MLARKTMLIMAGNVVGGILGVIALKLIAVHFGDAVWGQVVFATALVGMAYVLQDMGFTQAHIKFVSGGHDLGRCMTTFLVIKVFLTLLFALAVIGVLAVYETLLDKPLITTTRNAVYVMLVVNVVTSLRAVSRFTLDGRQETAKGQVLTFVENVTRVLATAVFAAAIAVGFGSAGFAEWTRAHPTEALALTFLAGAVASGLYSVYALRGIPWGAFDRDLAVQYARFAFPFTLISLIGIAATNIDAFTVGYFWSAREVGHLGGAQRITLLLSMVSVAVGTVLFPQISTLHASNRREEVRRVFERTLRYIGLIVAPLTVFVVAYPDEIIRLLLASDFTGGSDVLVVLAITALLSSLTAPYVALMSGMNRPATAAKVGAVSAFLIIALDFVLVPTSLFGIPMAGLRALGAALGTLAATVVGFLLLRVATHQLLGVGGAYGHLLRQLVGSLVLYGTLVGLAAVIPDFGRWYTLIAAGLAGGLVYLLALVAMREVTREDWVYARDLLNPATTVRYMRDELKGR